MSEPDSAQQYAVDGVLLPLAEGNLLLPSSVVVELLDYPEAINPAGDTPNWYVGKFGWRGLSLPLVCWERLTGQAGIGNGRRKHVAICHVFSGDETTSFVGLETSGLPRLLSVTQEDLQAREGSAEPESCILAEVSVHDSLAYIPDLDALGKMLVSFPR